MGDHYASGNWHVSDGKEEEFVERWTEFLRWTRETQEAFGTASLIRDEKDPRHFISFADWKDPGARDAWRQSPGFMERFSACRELCDEFYGGDYRRAVTV